MSQFCQECGQQLKSEDVVCTNCGTRHHKETVVPKQPLSNKRKAVYRIIAVITVLLIGCLVWANTHYSRESTSKRFAEAISNKNAKGLQTLVVHEDGSAISEQEANAMVKLVKEEGEKTVQLLTSVRQHGKLLGLFKKYKMEAVDQYAFYDGPIESLVFTFNEIEMREEKRKKDSVTYGPLTPGVYEVKTTFKGKYGKGTAKSELALINAKDIPSSINVDLPLGNAVFEIANYSSTFMKDIYVVINDEKIPIDEYGETVEIGPILFDGSQKAKVVVQYPWGEVSTNETTIESEYQVMRADILSQAELKKVMDTLKQFGEEYIESKAKRSTAVYTTTTESLNDLLQKNILAPLINNNRYVTGEFEELNIDENSVNVLDDSDQGISIQAVFRFMDDEHSLSDTPSLSEAVHVCEVELIYDEGKQKWFVQNSISTWSNVDVTTTLHGSGTLHQPGVDTVQAEKESLLREELESFMFHYVNRSVEAINARDFSYVEHLMTNDGPRKKESRDYIDYLESKGITEQLISSVVEKVEEAGAETWKVTTTEEFVIHYPEVSKNKKFTTIVLVKKIHDDWRVHELVSTKEI